MSNKRASVAARYRTFSSETPLRSLVEINEDDVEKGETEQQEQTESLMATRREILIQDDDDIDNSRGSGSNDTIPRLIQRDMPHYQSGSQVSVLNRNAEWKLSYGYDFFHTMLRWPTQRSIFVLLCIWTIMVCCFACVYQAIDDILPSVDCGLGKAGDPIRFPGAFAFSLETCTTVGYGLPSGNNAFFERCPGLQLVIYFQMVYSMLFNAFLLAFFFSRLARSETRAHQVLFSDKAIIEYRDGKWLFHARIYDLDAAQPIVEAHLRVYVASWTGYQRQFGLDRQPHLLHALRLLSPNDELGGVMFTSSK